MWTARFWQDALERAIKTFAQTLVALLGVGGAGLLDAPWTSSLSVAGLAAVLSVLSSLASESVGEHGSASVVVPPATETTATPS